MPLKILRSSSHGYELTGRSIRGRRLKKILWRSWSGDTGLGLKVYLSCKDWLDRAAAIVVAECK